MNKRHGAEIAQKIINPGLEGQHIFGKVKAEWKGSFMKNRAGTGRCTTAQIGVKVNVF